MKILLGNQSIQMFTAVHHFKMSKKAELSSAKSDKTMRAPLSSIMSMMTM